MQSANKILLNIKPAFAIFAAMAIILFPLKFIIAWAFASFVHELFHIIAMRVMKIDILSITLDGTGAIIETESISPCQELVCTILGPIGGISLLIFSEVAPGIALCALIQSVYNMLPYYPLDGGRALHSLFVLRMGEWKAAQMTRLMNRVLISLLLVMAVIMHARYGLGNILLFTVIILLLRSIKNNFALQTDNPNSTI